MTNIGFIGLGGMGRLQYTSFATGTDARIYAGADPSEPARSQFAKDHPDAKVYADPKAMLRDPALEAVVIAVPTGLHKAVAVAALRAGLPVLLEKPMARTVTEAKRILDAADKAQALLMIAHCRRFDPVWGAWAEPVRAGRLGRPVLWRHAVAGRGPSGWFVDHRMGGGPLLDGAVHNYDFGQFLWGDPERVVAQSIKLRDDATALDTATATVTYASGDQLMVSWCWGRQGGSLFDVLGPRGTLQVGPGSLTLPPEHDPQLHSAYCLTDCDGKATLLQGPRDSRVMYQRQAQHFLDCIAGRATCQSPGEQAIKAVAVGEAILRIAPRGGATKVQW